MPGRVVAALFLLILAPASAAWAADGGATGTNAGNPATPSPGADAAAPAKAGCDYPVRNFPETREGPPLWLHAGEGQRVTNPRTGAAWICRGGRLVKVQ